MMLIRTMLFLRLPNPLLLCLACRFAVVHQLFHLCCPCFLCFCELLLFPLCFIFLCNLLLLSFCVFFGFTFLLRHQVVDPADDRIRGSRPRTEPAGCWPRVPAEGRKLWRHVVFRHLCLTPEMKWHYFKVLFRLFWSRLFRWVAWKNKNKLYNRNDCVYKEHCVVFIEQKLPYEIVASTSSSSWFQRTPDPRNTALGFKLYVLWGQYCTAASLLNVSPETMLAPVCSCGFSATILWSAALCRVVFF